MIFNLMFLYIIFSSVRVTEWPPLGKEQLTRLTICSLSLTICYFSYIAQTNPCIMQRFLEAVKMIILDEKR